MTEYRQFFLIILLLTKIGLDLLQQDGSRVTNIKAVQFLQIDKDSDKGGPSQLCVDIAVKYLLIGGLEGKIAYFNKLFPIRMVVILLQ